MKMRSAQFDSELAVSIHVPRAGRVFESRFAGRNLRVSIRARPWDATICRPMLCYYLKFHSTANTECGVYYERRAIPNLFQSTPLSRTRQGIDYSHPMYS